MSIEKLLEKINQYVKKLAEASVWSGSKESIPFVSELDEETSQFYIYEFYCYIRIVEDLKNVEEYQLEYIPGSGEFLHKFPKAPADKKGKPRFNVLNKNEELICHVCAGTKVKGYGGVNFHPDISFQNGKEEEGEDPDYKHLIMIHDAKFQQKPGSTLRKDEVFKFAEIVRIYDLNLNNNSRSINVKFNKLKGLEGNCLLTNVKGHPQIAVYLKSVGIKEVVEFCEGKPVKVIPRLHYDCEKVPLKKE
jgi:hypothetical protein